MFSLEHPCPSCRARVSSPPYFFVLIKPMWQHSKRFKNPCHPNNPNSIKTDVAVELVTFQTC